MTEYRQGTTATLLVTFYAYPGGPLANVSNLTITISPTGGGPAAIGPTSSGVVNESVGLYSYAWAIDADQTVGTYVVEWNADNDVTASETATVISASTTTYATVAELKTRLDIGDTDDDTRLDEALQAASREIDLYCGRVFTKATTASARVFRPEHCGLVYVDDFHTTTGLVVATDAGEDGTYETTITSGSYELWPLNGVVDGQTGWPYRKIRTVNTYLPVTGRASVQVTAQWGWDQVPGPVKEACLVIAAELFKLGDAPFGVAGFGEFGAVRLRLNSRAQTLLNPYRLTAFLVA